MGNSQINPVKELHSCVSPRFICVHATAQGARNSNEDAHILNCRDHVFAVLDGHDGKHVAKYLSEHLGETICRNANQKSDQEQDSPPFGLLTDEELKKIFIDTDAQLKEYMHIERVGFNGEKFSGGSTAVVALVDTTQSPDEFEIVCVNTGDSRAFFIDGSNSLVTLSKDHKPKGERDRIERAGGRVLNGRVCLSKTSTLSMGVTRAFGDFTFKANPARSLADQVITALPDVIRVRRPWKVDTPKGKKSHGSDKVHPTICIACDGLFDVMNSAQVKDMITNFYEKCKLFDGSPLSSDLMEPLVDCFLYKEFKKWFASDVDSYFFSLGPEYAHISSLGILDGEMLSDLATGKLSRDAFLRKGNKQHLGLVYDKLIPHLQEERERQARWKSRAPPTSATEKLQWLASMIIDRALYQFRSSDNVSVMLCVFQEPGAEEK